MQNDLNVLIGSLLKAVAAVDVGLKRSRQQAVDQTLLAAVQQARQVPREPQEN